MKIRTVCGDLDPEKLGMTLLHEHLMVDLATTYLGTSTSEVALDKEFYQPLSMKNLGKVRRTPNSIRDNIVLDDVELISREVRYFREAGGQCIVEQTPVGLRTSGNRALDLQYISQATGVSIVASSGFYLPETLPPEILDRDVESLASQMITEIAEGFENTDVRAGLLGEIGATGDFTPFEKKVLQAVAMAQKVTGAGVSLHTACPAQLCGSSRNMCWRERVLAVLDFLESCNADLTRVVVGHADVTVDVDVDDHIEILKRGVYLEYDNFAQEHPYDKENTYAPTDWQRIQNIIRLSEKGYLKQLVISTDLWQKAMLREYGGWGLEHITVNICPMLKKNGLNQKDIDCLLIDNARRILAF